MKSSDLKVVAIILSIALFFTILTSNAVSIASVVLLAKGGTGAPVQTVAPQGGTPTTPSGSTSTTPSGSTSTTPSGSTSTTPDANAQTPAGDQGGATAQTPAGNTGTQAPAGNTGTQAPAGNQGGAATGKIDKAALKMFQDEAKRINSSGCAGYTKKSWQEIESINIGGNDALKGLIEGFMTKEADAVDKVSEKGSEDAMNRMPPSNCSEGKIESVTRETLDNGNYKITIVMKDEINPTKAATDGLNIMSRDLLYMEDVENTIKTDKAVQILVKGLNKGEINYQAFTITAEMTKDGKFVSISHECKAALLADVKLMIGGLQGDGVLVFKCKYWDFKY